VPRVIDPAWPENAVIIRVVVNRRGISPQVAPGIAHLCRSLTRISHAALQGLLKLYKEDVGRSLEAMN